LSGGSSAIIAQPSDSCADGSNEFAAHWRARLRLNNQLSSDHWFFAVGYLERRRHQPRLVRTLQRSCGSTSANSHRSSPPKSCLKRCFWIARSMALSASPIASSRVLPCPDILVPATVAAHFQWWRTMPCTTEYSIPRYSIAIAFVVFFTANVIEHGPRPLGALGLRRGPGRPTDAVPSGPRTKRPYGYSCSMPTTSKWHCPAGPGLSLAFAYERRLSMKAILFVGQFKAGIPLYR
jgi:hypothetical protein